MKGRIEVDGKIHEVGIDGKGPWKVDVDGDVFEVSTAPGGLRIGARTVSVLQPGADLPIDGAATADSFVKEGPAADLLIDGVAVRVRVLEANAGASAGLGAGGPAKIRPPMNGKLERLLVKAGDTVVRGQVLFILEAMKMQNEVRSPAAGRVSSVHLAVGAVVEPSQVVLELEPS